MKIQLSEFKKMVLEEMRAIGMLSEAKSDKKNLRSVEDAKAKEIEPGEEAQLDGEVDVKKALKIKESRLIRELLAVRSQIKKNSK